MPISATLPTLGATRTDFEFLQQAMLILLSELSQLLFLLLGLPLHSTVVAYHLGFNEAVTYSERPSLTTSILIVFIPTSGILHYISLSYCQYSLLSKII